MGEALVGEEERQAVCGGARQDHDVPLADPGGWEGGGGVWGDGRGEGEEEEKVRRR